MKKHINVILLALLGIISPCVSSARADLEVSVGVQVHAVGDFYSPLSPYGSWVEIGTYGRCWRPAQVEVEWRPYCTGSWVYTDCGWYWVSDEPWAWACYHYGWWVDDPTFGWIWVPGIEWAPAWVEWRVGGGCIGWAPLPPAGLFVRSAPTASFVFVKEAHFGDPVRPSTVIVNNTTLIKQTTVVGGIKHDNRTFAGSSHPQRVAINQGPSVGVLQKATGRTFTPTPVQQVARHTPLPQGMNHGALNPVGRDVPRSAPSARPLPGTPPTPQAPPPSDTRPRGPEHRPVPGFVPEHGNERFGPRDERHGPPPVPPGREPGHDQDHGRDQGRL